MSFDVLVDSWIGSNTINSNFGDDPEVWVGVFSYGEVKVQRRTLLWFDISALPADAIVDSATLELVQIRADGEESYQIWPHQITGGWAEEEVTWENAPFSVSAGDPATSLDTAPGVEIWGVSGIVQAWQAGAGNFGILLSGDGTTVGTRAFRSAENSGVPPRLNIYYHQPADETPEPPARVYLPLVMK